MQVVPGAVKLAPHPHCRALQPGEFNGIIPSPLPVYSESFIEFHASVSCNVADRHSYKVTNACDQNNTSTAVDRWRYKFFAVFGQVTLIWPILPCDAMYKRDLCRRAISVRPSVCLSVRHVRVFCRNQ